MSSLMTPPLSARAEAEAIEAFGDQLAKLCREFCTGFANETVDRVCAVPNQEHLDEVAKAFQVLGSLMQDECDAAEEADMFRRANPIEPGFRRLDR